jgi:hypothetical protein
MLEDIGGIISGSSTLARYAGVRADAMNGWRAAAVGLTALVSAACGAGASHTRSVPKTAPAPGTPSAAIEQGLQTAGHPVAGEFPVARGKTLLALANQVARRQIAVALSTSVALPGPYRFAFGLVGTDNHFVYGPSAVYVAPSRSSPAQGPYPAPIDSMLVHPRFASTTVAQDPLASKGIYETRVPLSKPGLWAALVLTHTSQGWLAGVTQFVVRKSSDIPNVGQRPPRIHTPTAASTGGDLAKIDTRIPPDDMHRVDFASVIGKRPVALLFATPALCQSRVCGPVTDIVFQLEHEYSSRMTFIHNEVYVDNDASKGLRSQLLAFHLQTEPWLFTFNREGGIAARLEGAFGVRDARQAIEAALR